MESLLVQRAVVVTVSRNSPQTCIAEKTVAAGGIGQQGKEILIPQIVDPGQRRARRCNDIFAANIVKESEPHRFKLLSIHAKTFKIR